MTAAARGPFRADHVGSLLRPAALKALRLEKEAGRVGADRLAAAEDASIREVVKLQEEVGLQGITDGEHRRKSWHMDFLLQLDGWSSQGQTIPVTLHGQGGQHQARGEHTNAQLALPVKMNRATLRDKPADMAIYTHLIRGNFRSAWRAQGGYARIAETIFTQMPYDGFFLEFDDARSGDFSPLRHVPKPVRVVLGLVTSKVGALENRDDLRRRLDEAAKYIAMDQLAISPQCGFSSTVEGNELTIEAQKAKLALCVSVAREVWGGLSSE